MSGDTVDQLYNAVHADGAVTGTREEFRKFFLAPGKQGYQNRLQFYNDLHARGAVSSGTYEEFAQRMGLHARSRSKAVQQAVAYKTQVPNNFGGLDTQTAGMSWLQRQNMTQKQKAASEKRKAASRAAVNGNVVGAGEAVTGQKAVAPVYREKKEGKYWNPVTETEMGNDTVLDWSTTDANGDKVANVDKKQNFEADAAAKALIRSFSHSKHDNAFEGFDKDFGKLLNEKKDDWHVKWDAISDMPTIGDVDEKVRPFGMEETAFQKVYNEHGPKVSTEEDYKTFLESHSSEIANMARQLHMTPDALVSKYIAPNFGSIDEEEYRKSAKKFFTPKNFSDRIIQGLLTSGEANMLHITPDDYQDLRNEAITDYQEENSRELDNKGVFSKEGIAALGRNLTVGGAQVAPSGVGFAFGGAEAKGTIKGLEMGWNALRRTGLATKILGKAVPKTVAALTKRYGAATAGKILSTVNNESLGSYMLASARQFGQGSLTMGYFEANNYLATEGREKIREGKWGELAEGLYTHGMSGLGTGMLFSGIGTVTGALGRNLGITGAEASRLEKVKHGTQKALFSASALFAEGLGFRAEELYDEAKKGELTLGSVLENGGKGVIDKITMDLGMAAGKGKLPNLKQMIAGKVMNTNPHVTFSTAEKNELLRSTGGKSLLEALDGIGEGNVPPMYRKKFGEFFTDPNISRRTKQKVAYVVGKAIDTNIPRTERVSITQGTGGTQEVRTYSKDGELLTIDVYENKEKAEMAKEKVYVKRDRDDAAVLVNDSLKPTQDEMDKIAENTAGAMGFDNVGEYLAALHDAGETQDADFLSKHAKVWQEEMGKVLSWRHKALLDTMRDVNNEYSVDIDKLLTQKDPSLWKEVERDAVLEFCNRLKKGFSDKNDEAQNNAVARQDGADLSEQTELEDSEKFTENAKSVNDRQASATEAWMEMVKNNPDLDEWMKSNPNASVEELRENFGEDVADAYMELSNAQAMREGFMQNTGSKIEDAVRNQAGQAKFTGTMRDKQGGKVITDDVVTIFADKDGNEYTLVGGDVIADIAGDGSYSAGESGLVIFRDKDGNLVQRTNFDGLNKVGVFPLEDYANRIRTTLQEQKTAEIQSTETPLPEAPKEEAPKGEKPATVAASEEPEPNEANSTVLDNPEFYKVANSLQNKVGQSLSMDEANSLVSEMEGRAEPARELELTPENWTAEFGEDGKVNTPVGKVKMGENQLAKLFMKGRDAEFGMIKPTLTSPDVIIEEESKAADGNEERTSSYLFVKTFIRDGEKVKFFTSVTVKKDGMEVSVSSHIKSKNAIDKKMQEGKILYIKGVSTSNSSDRHLAEHPNGVPDLLPTQEDDTPSDGKDTTKSSDLQASNETLTFKDGTEAPKNYDLNDIPMDDNGEPIYESVPKERTVQDLFGKLDDGNLAREYSEMRVSEAEKELKEAKKKEPKMGTKINEYLKKKQEYEDRVKAAEDKVAYWESVKEDIEKLTHTTTEELKEAKEELDGTSAREEFKKTFDETQPADGVALAAKFVADAKVTPESFKKETGMGAAEQKSFVGMIAKEEKGGKSIERLGEDLVYLDNDEYGGVYFHGDSNDARSAIISALTGAKTRKGLREMAEPDMERAVSERAQMRDEAYNERYGMDYEEYLLYSEQEMPHILGNLNNFDEQKYLQDKAVDIINQLDKEYGKVTGENDSRGEESVHVEGDKVLSEERPNDGGGGESPEKHGGGEKDERRSNTPDAPLHETPSRREGGVKPADPSDVAEGIREAAEQFHQERVEKARKAYEEAKASGDTSETKRTKDEYRKALDDKLKAQGIGLVERRKTIAKEMGEEPKVEEPKGEAPKNGKKHWDSLTPTEKVEKADADPLTEEEIRSDEENKELAAAAIAYLNGDKSLLNQIAYLKIYGNVRNRHEDVPGNSGTEDKTQLATSGTGSGEGLGLEPGRSGGGSAEPLDSGTGGEAAPGKRESGTNSEGGPDTAAGEGGDIKGEGNTPGLDGVPAGGGGRERGGTAGSKGNLGSGRGRGSGNGPSKPDGKRKPAAKQGTTFPNSKGSDVKKETSDAKAAMKAAFAEFKKRGKNGSASISLVGMNNEQIEYLPELMKATGRYGIAVMREGIYKAKEWFDNIREAISDDMKDIGFKDADIDEYIREMWHMPWEMDGETHKIGEWASIKGYANLRESLKEPLRKKFDKQVLAEATEVKVGDRKNIEETLPFLLPQQQDDVLKAETQFFDESHKDKAHAGGKGYMFTNGTGTGKTYTGLGIIKRMTKQGKGRILIITPSQQKVKDWINDGKNLCLDIRDLDDWSKEHGSTATNEKGEGVVITTFANFGINKALLEDQFDAVIYDESHRIMENKEAKETARSRQHYMLTNRNERYALMRLEEVNPDCMKMRRLAEDFENARKKETARIKAEYEKNNPSADAADVRVYMAKSTPRDIQSFSMADKAKHPELGKIYEDYRKARDYYINNVKPELEKQAKESVDKTKVVFLSATPFNTRENIEYAEGYLFSYPERNESGQSGKAQFFLDHFGAGYKFRYNRLERSTANAEALAKQEVAFSDWLQNDLGTMSGRIIDSPYDYSRDFPTVSVEHARDFNEACEEISRDDVFGAAYREVLGDYNYGSALFETMKVAAMLPRLREHIAAGRKVVVFHRRVSSKEPLQAPFGMILGENAEKAIKKLPKDKQPEARTRLNELRSKYSELLKWEQTLDFSMPREQLAKAFGEDNVLYFSGQESSKVKNEAVKQFNDDNSGKNIIVIQEASGKEGISLHDTTGKHQRVCITLALPQSPITALQIEGRTYRIGNESNAIFEYPVLGLVSEYNLFASKFNQQVSTTENLALGSQARNLRESFARGIEEHSGYVPLDQQGVGGKDFDKADESDSDPYDNAILDYYTNQKLNRNNREGVDYFPTPEQLGYKIVEWANIGEGDSVLEPSAGHGAIARYAPQANELVAIEPSMSLFAKLQMKAGGLGRKFQNDTFENYYIGNKHDTVVMNPPFGKAGATAIAHVGKAFGHLEEGGRVVAIIPRGAMDKKFDKWYEGEKSAVLRAEIDLPDIVFEQAGTKVRCRVVVIDKITDSSLRARAEMTQVDLNRHYDKIEDFFEDLRDVEVPERIIDQQAKQMKKSKATVSELRNMRGVYDVSLDRDGIEVGARGVRERIEFKENESADAFKKRMAGLYDQFAQNEKRCANYNMDASAVYGELKDLTCKLANMTEDEMRRYLTSKNSNSYDEGGVRFRKGEGTGKYAKESRIVPQDVDKEVSSQIEKKFDEDIEKAFPDEKERGRAESVIYDFVEFYSYMKTSEIIDNVNEWKENDGRERRDGGESSSRMHYTAVRFKAAMLASEREMEYRRIRTNRIKSLFGIEGSGRQIPINGISKAFEETKGRDSRGREGLFRASLDIAKRLGTKFYLEEAGPKASHAGVTDTNREIRFFLDGLTRTATKAEEFNVTIVHELLHQSVNGAINLVKKGKAEGFLSEKQIDGAKTILDIYNKVKGDKERFKENTYGLKSEYEFAAQMADQRQRQALDTDIFERVVSAARELVKKGDYSLWQRVKDALGKLFGTSDLKKMDKALNNIMDDFKEVVHDYSMDDIEQEGFGYKVNEPEETDEVKKWNNSLRFRNEGEMTPEERREERRLDEHRSTVEKAAEKLNTDVTICESIDDVTNAEARAAIERGERVKAWYDTRTGEVHLYLPNVTDKYDAQKSIAHEVIGHKGMRGLLGEDGYRTMLRRMYTHLSDAEAREVNERMMRNGWDFYTAMDEWVADKAEESVWQPQEYPKYIGLSNLWSHIKKSVTEAMHKAGYYINPNVDDVKYWLWESKRALRDGNAETEMRRNAFLWKLGHEKMNDDVVMGEYTGDGEAGDEMEISTLFRSTSIDENKHDTLEKRSQKQQIDDILKSSAYRHTEAFGDSDISLKTTIEVMSKGLPDGMNDSMNFYDGNNQLSSVVFDRMEKFMFTKGKQLNDVIRKCRRVLGGKDRDFDRLNLYAIVKHGLERNRWLYVRKAAEALDKKIREMNAVISKDGGVAIVSVYGDALKTEFLDFAKRKREELYSGGISYGDYLHALDDFIKDYTIDMESIPENERSAVSKLEKWLDEHFSGVYTAGGNDYSGLRGIEELRTEDGIDDAAAIDRVSSMENELGEELTRELWTNTKSVTFAGLEWQYKHGLISKKQFEQTQELFAYYVPLRGFSKETMEDQYAYMRGGSGEGKGSLIMKAEGRKSLSVSPFSTALYQTNLAIERASRNQNNQRAWRFALAWTKNNTEIGEDGKVKMKEEAPILISDVWYKKNEDGVWEVSAPEITEGMSADEVRSAVESHESEMRSLQAEGKAKKRLTDKDRVPFGSVFEESSHRNEHVVDVWMNGERKRLIFMNPKAAQALNGELSRGQTDSIYRYLRKGLRTMSSLMTTYNATFAGRNFIRDYQFANDNVFIKEGRAYWLQMCKNQMRLLGERVDKDGNVSLMHVLGKHNLWFKLWRDYRNGVAPRTEVERYFKEFMENGGRTGFNEALKVDKLEDNLRKASEAGNAKNFALHMLGGMGEVMDYLNERAENFNRFATYMTSRQTGRSVMRSIADAKNVTVNFNRRGAGSKAFGDRASRKDKMLGFVYDYVGSNHVFVNAAIQGYRIFAGNLRHHPVKTLGTMILTPMIMGQVIVPMLNAWLAGSLFDEEGDPYSTLSDWDRRNNICLYSGKGKWVKIPLAIEHRAFYGMGDLINAYIGKMLHKSGGTENGKTNWLGSMANESLVTPTKFGLRYGAAYDFTWGMIRQMLEIAPYNPVGSNGNVVSNVVFGDYISPVVEAARNEDWAGKPIYKDTPWNKDDPEWQRVFKGENAGLVYLSKKLNDWSLGDDYTPGLVDINPALVSHFITSYLGGAATDIIKLTDLAANFTEGTKEGWQKKDGNKVVNALKGGVKNTRTDDVAIVRAFYSMPTEKTKYYRALNKYATYKEYLEAYGERMNKKLKSDNVEYVKEANAEIYHNGVDMQRFHILDAYEEAIRNAIKYRNGKDVSEADKAIVDEDINMMKMEAVKEMESIFEAKPIKKKR